MLKANQADLPTLMREARRRFHDDSDLFLAFRELRRRRTLGGANVDVVEKALDEMTHGGDPKRIKAGVNAALSAKVFGRRMRVDPARLRQLYRQLLDSGSCFLRIYEEWIVQFGACQRKRIIEYVSAALSCDMQSLDPSYACVAEFGPLITTISNVRMLSSADVLFLGKLLTGALCGERITEECALRLMLGGLQRPFEIERLLLDALGPLLARLNPTSRSLLLQRALRGFACIPNGLYPEVEARNALISIVKAMNAELYRRERSRVYRSHTSVCV